MYRRHELAGTLSPDEVIQTLSVSNLSEKEEYTEEEADRFRECRSLMEQGKPLEEITQVLQQNEQLLTAAAQPQESDNLPKGKRARNSKKSAKTLDFSELLSLACEHGSRISLTEAIKIMQACGLSADAEHYSQPEGDRFLEGCELVKRKDQTYEQVATHFGIAVVEDEAVVQQIEQVIEAMQNQAASLTEELIDETAEAHALADAQRYFAKYVRAASEGPKVQNFWNRMREYAQARLEGKSPARLMRAEPQSNLILPSSLSSIDSSMNCESGMTDE